MQLRCRAVKIETAPQCANQHGTKYYTAYY